MGPAGLTAVFGMGTGGAPRVSSPEGGDQGFKPGHPGDQDRSGSWCHTRTSKSRSKRASYQIRASRFRDDSCLDPEGCGRNALVAVVREMRLGLGHRDSFEPDRINEIKSGGGESGWSSVLAVRTGRLRRSLAVHFRPIDLVVFQEPS